MSSRALLKQRNFSFRNVLTNFIWILSYQPQIYHNPIQSTNMSGSAFTSLEETLNKYIPKEELLEVKRILYGQSEE